MVKCLPLSLFNEFIKLLLQLHQLIGLLNIYVQVNDKSKIS
jgi:hypothetical protein